MQSSSARPRRFPRNNSSAAARIAVLRKNVRKEQDLLRCLVVGKGTGDPRLTGRTMHDLSFPDEDSVNHRTDCSFVPRLTFEHASSIAREILRCKRGDPDPEVKVMPGDVSTAYRNACTHSECVHHFAGHIPDDNAIVIDLSAAFGWSGSAGAYGVLGGAVAFVHSCSSDSVHPHGYYNYHWVDDHVNVAADIGTRCADIERSLRFAMTAVLGPAAVNEQKFTAWSTRQQVLGLISDTVAGSVAMPPARIAKCASLVASALRAATMSRSEFRSLMGSLRQVATCVRPAQAFLQRLRSQEFCLCRTSRIRITADIRADLNWWRQILRDPALKGVPLDYFGSLPELDITVITDASDAGVCALVPERRLALSYLFTQRERGLITACKQSGSNEFDINYRELLSCAFAMRV